MAEEVVVEIFGFTAAITITLRKREFIPSVVVLHHIWFPPSDSCKQKQGLFLVVLCHGNSISVISQW